MSEKRFKLSSETVLQYQIMDNDTDLNENEVVDCLNEQQAEIDDLKEENEQLRKQIQNYEQLIANSYVGEQERWE